MVVNGGTVVIYCGNRGREMEMGMTKEERGTEARGGRSGGGNEEYNRHV